MASKPPSSRAAKTTRRSTASRAAPKPVAPAARTSQVAAKSPRAAGDGPRYWLVKSEPSEFSFDQLWAAPQRTTMWDGVRNYQARNTLRDEMAVGDEVFYYHSNAEVIGIVGIARVASRAYPDPTQFERGHVHEDPTSPASDPRWMLVDLQALRRLPRTVTLEELKANPKLSGMVLLQRGSRLSVQPVAEEHWREILRMADGRAQAP